MYTKTFILDVINRCPALITTNVFYSRNSQTEVCKSLRVCVETAETSDEMAMLDENK